MNFASIILLLPSSLSLPQSEWKCVCVYAHAHPFSRAPILHKLYPIVKNSNTKFAPPQSASMGCLKRPKKTKTQIKTHKNYQYGMYLSIWLKRSYKFVSKHTLIMLIVVVIHSSSYRHLNEMIIHWSTGSTFSSSPQLLPTKMEWLGILFGSGQFALNLCSSLSSKSSHPLARGKAPTIWLWKWTWLPG